MEISFHILPMNKTYVKHAEEKTPRGINAVHEFNLEIYPFLTST